MPVVTKIKRNQRTKPVSECKREENWNFTENIPARRFPIFFARFELLTTIPAELSVSWNMTISREDEAVL